LGRLFCPAGNQQIHQAELWSLWTLGQRDLAALAEIDKSTLNRMERSGDAPARGLRTWIVASGSTQEHIARFHLIDLLLTLAESVTRQTPSGNFLTQRRNSG
jgi:hypothetical protein